MIYASIFVAILTPFILHMDKFLKEYRMTLRKLISVSFFTLILSSSALHATTIFGADDELDQAMERGHHSNPISIAQLRQILTQESFPFLNKPQPQSMESQSTTAFPRTSRTSKKSLDIKLTINSDVSDSDSEDCVVVLPPKKKEKKQKEDVTPNRLIFELDDEGEVVGNKELFAEEAFKNRRLETIRDDYHAWSKRIRATAQQQKRKEQEAQRSIQFMNMAQIFNLSPSDMSTVSPYYSFLYSDEPLTQDEILASAKKTPFLQEMLDKGMTEEEVNEMRIKDIVPLYDGKDLEFFNKRS